MGKSLFHFLENKIYEKASFYAIKLDTFNVQNQKYLDDIIISICCGISDESVLSVKRSLYKTFFSQNVIERKMGACSEFFIHCFLKELSFKQEFLFRNLEESQFKKGFDGLYTHNNDIWLLESKSGNHHKKFNNKVSEAYIDLKHKINGKNNPWLNAFYHSDLRSVNTDQSIQKTIKSLSNDFNLSVFHDISGFNIIPCATIYFPNSYDSNFKIESIEHFKDKFDYKKIIVICISSFILDEFEEYLNV